MDDKLGVVLTIEELAGKLKIRKSAFYTLVREGKILFQKIVCTSLSRKESFTTGYGKCGRPGPVQEDSNNGGTSFRYSHN
jgi:hypothetical protein